MATGFGRPWSDLAWLRLGASSEVAGGAWGDLRWTQWWGCWWRGCAAPEQHAGAAPSSSGVGRLVETVVRAQDPAARLLLAGGSRGTASAGTGAGAGGSFPSVLCGAGLVAVGGRLVRACGG